MSVCRWLALLACLSWPAMAEPSAGPVCGSPEVLRVVSEILASRGRHVTIEPPAGQVPAASQLVACTVRVFELGYDTNRLGPVPFEREEVFAYTVRRGLNGLFVEASGTGTGR